MKAKKEIENFRSSCPVSSALDLFGDKWSLIIVRDIVYYGERTFKDFSQNTEKISSARLSDRLIKLEELGIITKNQHPTNKKVFLYDLTRKGLDLTPVIIEFVLWSAKYLKNHISEESMSLVNDLNKNKEGVIVEIYKRHSLKFKK